MYDLNLIANKTEIKFGESGELEAAEQYPRKFYLPGVSTPAGASLRLSLT